MDQSASGIEMKGTLYNTVKHTAYLCYLHREGNIYSAADFDEGPAIVVKLKPLQQQHQNIWLLLYQTFLKDESQLFKCQIVNAQKYVFSSPSLTIVASALASQFSQYIWFSPLTNEARKNSSRPST